MAIFREVSGNPVNNDTNASLVAGVDEVFEFIRRTKTAGWREQPDWLITP